MEIIYWSDYACPYCYIGETRLKKEIDELREELAQPVTLTMKAFRLDPDCGNVPESDTVTRYARKYKLSPMLAAHQVEKISLLGRREGLEFNYAETQFTNTLDAHRLTKYAKAKGDEVYQKLIEVLFKAYFAEGLMLADREVLVSAGVKAGLDEKEIKDFLDTNTFAEEVLQDEKEAHAKGVIGVPYFEINGREVYGAEHTANFKKIIREELSGADAEADDKANAVADTGDGHVCGHDGCKL